MSFKQMVALTQKPPVRPHLLKVFLSTNIARPGAEPLPHAPTRNFLDLNHGGCWCCEHSGSVVYHPSSSSSVPRQGFCDGEAGTLTECRNWVWMGRPERTRSFRCSVCIFESTCKPEYAREYIFIPAVDFFFFTIVHSCAQSMAYKNDSVCWSDEHCFLFPGWPLLSVFLGRCLMGESFYILTHHTEFFHIVVLAHRGRLAVIPGLAPQHRWHFFIML